MGLRLRKKIFLISAGIVALLPLLLFYASERKDLDTELMKDGVVLQQSFINLRRVDDWRKTSTHPVNPDFIKHMEGWENHDNDRPYGELHQLLEHMENDWHFWWIRKRIQLLWPEFEAAGMRLNKGCQSEGGNRRRRVLILPGLLELTNFARPETIRKGGPLGELIQWADLIAASHALCHSVIVRSQFSSTIAQLRSEYFSGEHEEVPDANMTRGCLGNIDYIYTDIGGFRSLPDDVIDAYRHRFRIADAFGTEAAYNYPDYAVSHGTAINRWGMLNLRLKQFYTLYPHTPDNSFLGFVVSRSKLMANATKENFALIMGKEASYLVGKMHFLKTIHRVFPLRATMSSLASRHLPPGAETLGVIDSSTYQQLLRNAKVCVGLGDPVESPGVLEAIAQGCVFLNPRRKGDRAKLKGKPTSRQVNSQVPYFEEYIGPPYVYTVDEDDVAELSNILEIIRKTKSQSILPFEFSVEGFLQRLQAYGDHQDFCESSTGADTLWPPVTSLRTEIAPFNTSCKKACFDKRLVCEPAFFPILNSPEYLSNMTISCERIEFDAELYPPAFSSSTKTCFFQRQSQLFSCAGGELTNAQRICPCRDFQPFQVSLCKQCT